MENHHLSAALGYLINGALVSNFITPALFEAAGPKSRKMRFPWHAHGSAQLRQEGLSQRVPGKPDDSRLDAEAWHGLNEGQAAG